MLILSRRANESIIIGDDIKITILPSERPNATRLGITAPRSLPVHREEVYRKIQAEQDTKGNK
jgi:carbon storage regulator